jgi:hypothetical protein
MSRLLDRLPVWDWLMIFLVAISLVAVIVLVVLAMVLVSGKPR